MNRDEKRGQRNKAEVAGNVPLEHSANGSPPQKTFTLQQFIDLGMQHLTAGRLPEAEGIFQQILQIDPDQPVAMHLLGVIAMKL